MRFIEASHPLPDVADRDALPVFETQGSLGSHLSQCFSTRHALALRLLPFSRSSRNLA
jgi:hypothetical protein